MSTWTTTRLAQAALFTAAVTLAGGSVAAGSLDGANLRIGTWGGPWQKTQKELLVPKMEAMGAKVTFVSGSPPANMAKLIAARGGKAPMDLMEILDAIVPSMRDGGFLQPIDISQIPNVKYLAKGKFDDLMVSHWTTQEGICYNEAKFKELGIPAPKTYADLNHPKLVGRLQIPDIVSGGGLSAVAGFALANGGGIDNPSPGIKAIAKLKALKFWKRGAEALTQLKSGDIYAAVIHAGWCVRAVNAGMPVAAAHPVLNSQYTGLVKQGLWGIIKGSKNAKAAHAYINLFLDTDFQRTFAKNRGVVPENLESVKDLASDATLKKIMILDPAQIARMYRPDFSTANISAWMDEWNRTVAR